ncbi:hypothetical protein TRAPUB_8884 [Trametes pubescens]|uniref:YMC020W-like alpha/beta hydrolase domain-containing protein n=1 Tax=Trametes pubescens TaxID=154538 RepID=A0A1M2W3X6_TRAPU|nr:hypothetical protein TRAPUB_8884 [Trametes pubescens]
MSEASRKRERTLSQASSFIAQPERRVDENVQRQIEQHDAAVASRKRSKLSLHVPESTGPPATETLPANTEGTVTNPIVLVESPQTFVPSPEPAISVSEPQDDEGSTLAMSKLAVPFPSSEPQKTIRASKSTPARSSWFGFSRAKDDESSAHPGNTDAPSTSTATGPSTQSEQPVSPPSGAADSSHTSSATATPPQPVPLSVNPVSPMSFTPTQYSPPNHHINSNATSISSVDEEVPRPRITSLDSTTSSGTLAVPQVVVHSEGAKTAERKPSISSLNPSTSRFMLKLPLLGRPKIPLEQAVATAQSEDIRDPADHPTTVDEHAGVASEVPTESSTSVDSQETFTSPPPIEQTDLGQTSSAQSADTMGASISGQNTHGPRTASWWDYVGWGGASSEDHVKTSEDSKDSVGPQVTVQTESGPSTSVAADSSKVQFPDASPIVEAPPPADASTATVENAIPPTHTDTAAAPQAGQTAAKPSSVFSSDTVKSHGSTWYSPWAWYATSPTTALSPQGDFGNVADQPAADPEESPKTESELVKEKALAREQREAEAGSSAESAKPSPPESSVGEATPESVPAATDSLNPVESSIANNRSGWMSFLMSKTLTVKSVTNESHDEQADGMEVMEIDDAPQTSAAIPIPTGNDAQSAGAASSLSLKSTSPGASSPIPSPTPKSPLGKSPAVPLRKEREPRKSDPAAPLTENESIKRDTAKSAARASSPTPSKASGTAPPNGATPPPPNFVLPTWEDTFHSPPRSYVPPRSQGAKSKLTGALSFVTGALFSKDDSAPGKSRGKGKGKGKEREPPAPAPEFVRFGRELPKAFDILGEQLNPYMLNGGCRVVVIGVAGWSPGAVTRTLAGGLPSSSSKFVDMTAQALERFAEENGFKFKKITRMPLEGDGTIRKKVLRVYKHLINNEEWMEDLHAADVIFVASHSQGAIISTHLVDRLIEDGHILTSRSVDVLAKSVASLAAGGAAAVPATQAQKVCLLALCGIHLGPLRYLKTSSLLQPYIQYVENPAARELFEFQDTESKLSKNYVGALRNIMDHGAKVVYVASLNDQVVPIYSGLFTAASHPRILRALYIDNDAYHSSDFLSNLLILLIRILNAGLSDRGLLAHLSEATAGTLSGVGHSSAYEEPATYSLAVKYFFMTNDGTNADAELIINPFNAVEEQNDYEIPWLLRDMIADNKIAHFFAREFSQLRDAFDDWQPKTTILRDVKKKLQPITRMSTIQLAPGPSLSKL